MTNAPSGLSERSLEKIRTGQKFVIYAVLINVVVGFLLSRFLPKVVFNLIGLASFVLFLVGSFRLVVGLYAETTKRVLWAALIVCSFGLVALILAVRSSRVLKENGYKVGVLGAEPKGA